MLQQFIFLCFTSEVAFSIEPVEHTHFKIELRKKQYTISGVYEMWMMEYQGTAQLKKELERLLRVLVVSPDKIEPKIK